MSTVGLSKIKISAPGQYEGYSAQVYDGNKRRSIYFTASDGTRIALDYYIPTKNGRETEEQLPVIFHYTPYGRAIDEKMAEKLYGVTEKGIYFDDWGIEGLLELGSYGYVLAIAEVRGTGASFGARLTTNSRREAQDGKEIIEWLAAQPFSNGKVVMAGYSYTGQTQLECISMCPKGLTAAFLCMTDFDKYDGWIRGGIPRAFGTKPDIFYGNTEEEINATIEKIASETVPVDEDPDGVLLRQSIREHMNSGSQLEIMRDLNWRDSYLEASGGPHWKVIGASTYLENINASGVACYLVGGVYDVFRRDTFIMYHNLDLPKKLLMGHWYHMDQKVDPRWDVEMHRWFDYWAKGIDNGIMDEKPMTIRMANYNFKTHSMIGADTGYYINKESWPLHDGGRKVLYLDNTQIDSASRFDNGALVRQCPEKVTGVDFIDPYGPGSSIESSLTTNETGNGIDQQGMTYTTTPVERDERIVGHPMAKVFFSLEDPGYMTENYDVDFFVSLSDYCPETDEAFLITEGQLRASMRATNANPPYGFLGLPWHRCNQGDNEYLTLGMTYMLDIDMLPTSYVLAKGHCIRVTITNSMDRMYYQGRLAYEENPECRKPKVRIYTGGEKATHVILPDIYR